MTRDRSRTGRWWPLLALPVLCCVGHVMLIAAGVGSVAAVTGAMTASVAVASSGVLLLSGVVVVVLLRRRAPNRDTHGRQRQTKGQEVTTAGPMASSAGARLGAALTRQEHRHE